LLKASALGLVPDRGMHYSSDLRFVAGIPRWPGGGALMQIKAAIGGGGTIGG
jgi:hypothetical protein